MATTVEKLPKPVRLNSSGTLRVGSSRVSLDSVVYAFSRGEEAAEIQRNFDTLYLAEVHAAIAYYLHNKAGVDAYLAERKIEHDRFWREHEAKFPPKITREILLARKNGADPNWKE